MKFKSNLITALDIGSSKICALIAEIDEETSEPVIKGWGLVPSRGIKRGCIVNIEQASQAIATAVTEAEKIAGVAVNSCFVSISGEHIRCLNSSGTIAISGDSRTGLGDARAIEAADITRVLEHTQAVPLSPDRQILHVLPQEFVVDGQTGIQSPLNLTGRRLEARVHITTYSITAVTNLTRCIRNADLDVDGIVFEGLASAYATLDRDEKELGVILVDIGSGVTDVITFFQGGVYHTGVVNLGGFNVTNDIAYLLRTSLEKAEQIKHEYGFADASLIETGASFKLEGVGGRPPREVPLTQLSDYIEPRMEEILRETFMESRKADLPVSNALAVVLTGGGALLRGTEEICETVFKAPARIGYPRGFQEFTEELNSPVYTAAIGLLKYAIESRQGSTRRRRESGLPGRMWAKVKHFFENIM